ncbi:MAG: DmsE family decaheme c-type cytochrome [Pseudohongiellaceae bacterium]
MHSHALCLIPGNLSVLLIFLCLSMGIKAQSSADAQADYMADDPRVCLVCHGAGSPVAADSILQGAHGIVGNTDSPFAPDQQGCQSCHGPSAAHLRLDPVGTRPLPAMVFDQRQPAHEQDSVCLGCHETETGHYWSGSGHQFAELSCASCHSVHNLVDQTTSFQGGTAQCVSCHQRQQAEILQASSHPLRSGQMVCTDCHAPHGGPGPADLRAFTLNEQCFGCHAEKRGPFLWEHAPVAEDCSNCHTPHGSSHRNLLQARTPWLCQQCHLAAFHPSNLESGLGIPPRGASGNILGRDCSNCHTQVHGSNHPSGSGLTR